MRIATFSGMAAAAKGRCGIYRYREFHDAAQFGIPSFSTCSHCMDIMLFCPCSFRFTWVVLTSWVMTELQVGLAKLGVIGGGTALRFLNGVPVAR
jgi:hypothetical protein